MKKKVLVAMSGGVDSSVAALLLLSKGYHVAGATMVMFNNKDVNKQLIGDAKMVADKLKIDHYVLNCEKDFESTVIADFVTQYKLGKTPNPCVVCNKNIKFGVFLKYAKKMGFDYISTGHYADVVYSADNNEYLLKKSVCEGKDQSYVLYNLTQEILPLVLFPLANLTKEEVKKIAIEKKLFVKNKPESQDICFIPSGNYISFLEEYTQQKSPVGNFITEEGNVLGKHSGIWNYTIGQRKKLGVSFNKKMFVSEINIEDNNITLSETDPVNDRLMAENVNIVSPKMFKDGMVADVKIRYKHKQKPAKLYLKPNNELLVIFDEPQRAITKGQSVVFYKGDIVIGGGIIK